MNILRLHFQNHHIFIIEVSKGIYGMVIFSTNKNLHYEKLLSSDLLKLEQVDYIFATEG